MKQIQTHVWSLAGEEAVSYSLARGKAAAVTRESGEIAAYSLAPWREQSLALGACCAGQDRENTETVAKLSQPRRRARFSIRRTLLRLREKFKAESRRSHG